MSLGNENIMTGLKMIRINGVFHELNKYDVLGGRGGFVHDQNKVYRSLVQRNKKIYATCQDKKQKNNISRSIVTALYQKGGRFYCQKHDNSDSWYAMDDKDAIKKTSQALRETQPDLLSKNKSALKSPTSTMDPLPISIFIPPLIETDMIRKPSGQLPQQEQMDIEVEDSYLWQHAVRSFTSSIGTFSCSSLTNESLGQHHRQEKNDIVDESRTTSMDCLYE